MTHHSVLCPSSPGVRDLELPAAPAGCEHACHVIKAWVLPPHTPRWLTSYSGLPPTQASCTATLCPHHQVHRLRRGFPAGTQGSWPGSVHKELHDSGSGEGALATHSARSHTWHRCLLESLSNCPRRGLPLVRQAALTQGTLPGFPGLLVPPLQGPGSWCPAWARGGHPEAPQVFDPGTLGCTPNCRLAGEDGEGSGCDGSRDRRGGPQVTLSRNLCCGAVLPPCRNCRRADS